MQKRNKKRAPYLPLVLNQGNLDIEPVISRNMHRRSTIINQKENIPDLFPPDVRNQPFERKSVSVVKLESNLLS